MGSLEPNRDVFQLDPPEIIEGALTDQGLAHLLYQGEALVGYQLLRFPEQRPDNLGRDRGWTTAEQLNRVFHFETIYLDPTVRGQGLQLKLHALGAEAALLAGKTAGFATISPLNYPSASNALRFGLQGVAFRKKYSSNPRIVFFRDFTPTPNNLPATEATLTWIEASATDFLVEVERQFSLGRTLVTALRIEASFKLGFAEAPAQNLT